MFSALTPIVVLVQADFQWTPTITFVLIDLQSQQIRFLEVEEEERYA